jgi:hypothetical protein
VAREAGNLFVEPHLVTLLPGVRRHCRAASEVASEASSRIRYAPHPPFVSVFGMPNIEEASNGYRQWMSSCSMKGRGF